MKDSTLQFNNSNQGKYAIVTGANDGLGYETSRYFASQGINVVMACRNLNKANIAKESILKEFPTSSLSILQIDLKDLNSVREFVNNYKASFGQLDILVNNAGIMIPPFELTKDGFESQIGVNYLSHFLLTSLLIDLLNNSNAGRVISLSSIAHKAGKINLDNINSKGNYNKVAAYSQSKLACLMFCFELNRKLKQQGSSVKSIAAHPGVSATNLFQHLPKWFHFISPILAPLFSHSPRNAVMPVIKAALDENLKGGDYIGPTGFNEMKGKPGFAKSTAYSNNSDIAQQLWVLSETMTEITFLEN